MQTIFSLAAAVILVVTLASRPAAQGCPDVTGCWAGTFDGSFSGTWELALQQTGNNITGRAIVGALGAQTFDLFGTMTCDAISVTFEAVNLTGQVTGDCMGGTWSRDPLSGTWGGCRVLCVCGDGVLQTFESCDDGNTSAGDGCSDTCAVEPGWSCVGEPSVCTPFVCGNGVIQPGEACDDGNTAGGDGCSTICLIETGWICSGQPSVCTPIVCGNGVVEPGEGCDDGNTTGGDGCSAICLIETGWTCSGQPSLCSPVCGDGLIRGTEECDDGNLIFDGCGPKCYIWPGFTCTGEPSVCTCTGGCC